MSHRLFPMPAGLCLVSLLMVAPTSSQETTRTEQGNHPPLAEAVRTLERAIQYLETAPHDFGGRKALAIHDSRRALMQLRYALQYRQETENQSGQ